MIRDTRCPAPLRGLVAGTTAVAALALAIAGCGGGADDAAAPPATDAFTVEITRVVASQATIGCGGQRHPYVFLINVFMVNTTDDSVSVKNVKTIGSYVTADSAQYVGAPALTDSSATFTPLALRAHDGSGHFQLLLGGICPTLGGYGQIALNVFVTTETGNYAAKPIFLSFTFL